MNDILLSICIPTYNRANFLNRSLSYLTRQIESYVNRLEIIVLDNDSNDGTYNVVQNYIDLGFQISYIKNDHNLGPDINVDKCYQVAKGKYVLALGDDDIIVLNSLDKLMNILNTSDYGVIHLNAKPIESEIDYMLLNDNLNFKVFNNSDKFFSVVGYNITFISANIISKKYYDYNVSSKYLGSSLPQVPFIVHSILKAEKNLLIKDAIIRAEVDNSGGYNLLKVFSENLYHILIDISLQYPKSKMFQIITNKLLVYFFPFWIVKLKNSQNFSKNEKSNSMLFQLFRNNFRFWIYCFPLEYLPYRIAFIYNFILHIPHKSKKALFHLLKLFL
jgi:abequosyltransferase